MRPDKSRFLRRRKWLRGCVIVIGCGLLVASVVDQVIAGGDDWGKFDHKTFTIDHAISPDTIQLKDGRIVRLIGVTDGKSISYLNTRAGGKEATLRLEALATRDADGRVLAYVFLSDMDDLNADLILEGQAKADRSKDYSHYGEFVSDESEARKKGHGMWADLADSRTPVRHRKQPTTRPPAVMASALQ